jgi:proteasome accessory factor B
MKAKGDTRKTERLLDLLVLLLGAAEPVSISAIREQFSDYRGKNRETGARAFERDKKELVLLGVPLRCVRKGQSWPPGSGDELGEDSYIIDRDAYLLPELDLARDEIGALAVVAEVARAQAAFPYREGIDSALRKIAFDAQQPEAPPDLRLDLPMAHAGRAAKKHLRVLEEAVHGRKRLEIAYRKPGQPPAPRGTPGSVRTLDPYGLVYRQGSWLLVGLDHARREVRTFRVDRITRVKVAGKPGQPDFERPSDVDVRALALRSPWTFETTPPVRVVLETAPELAHLAREDFGLQAVSEILPSGGVRITFSCGNPSYVVTRVLAAAGRLMLLDPPALRQMVRQAAQAAAARYE